MKRGFTLVEILVVVALLSLLGGVSGLSYAGVRSRVNDNTRKSHLDALGSALLSKQLKSRNGLYLAMPDNTADTYIDVSDFQVNQTWLKTKLLVPDYRSFIPPNSEGAYCYYAKGDQSAFVLMATGMQKDQAGFKNADPVFPNTDLFKTVVGYGSTGNAACDAFDLTKCADADTYCLYRD